MTREAILIRQGELAMKLYKSPELRRLESERAYHEACAQQYADSATKLANPKLAQRANDNAAFHVGKLAQVNARIERLQPRGYQPDNAGGE